MENFTNTVESKKQQLLNSLINGIGENIKNIENSNEEKIDPSYTKEIGLNVKSVIENIRSENLSSEIMDASGRVSYLLSNENLPTETRFVELSKTLDSLKTDFENTEDNTKKKEMLICFITTPNASESKKRS